jgi:hypothetical protein
MRWTSAAEVSGRKRSAAFVALASIACLVVGDARVGSASAVLVADVVVDDTVCGEYQSLSPLRLLDTRPGTATSDGQFAGGGAVGPGTTLQLQIAGRVGLPTGVQLIAAVVLNVTSTGATAPSFISVFPTGTIYPTGDLRPATSSLNAEPGQDTPNLVIVPPGSDGRVGIYNDAGTGHLVADLVGWFPTCGPAFWSMLPYGTGGFRLLDTRPGTATVDGLYAGGGPLGAGGQIDLQVTGRVMGGGGEIPIPASGVAAVVLNVTSTGATAPSFITVWPTGEPRPNASSLNTDPGQDTPNLVIAKVGAGGQVSLYNEAGIGHLVADIVGWIPTGGLYTELSPTRLLDTRPGTATVDGQFVGGGVIGPDSTLQLQIAGRGNVPASGVTAVVLNVTSTGATAPSFITVWPTGEPRPNASSLNTDPGQDTPNLVIAKVGAGGQVSLYNEAGTGHLVADVVGYFSAG